MKKIVITFIFLIFITLSCFIVPVSTINAYYTNMPASVVIGQPDFVSAGLNQGGSAGANTLSSTENVATDGTKLFVTDRDNNRVLIFNKIPTTSNASADVVVGQQDFTSTSVNQGGSAAANTLSGPRGVFSDGTRLFVADLGNNRVLIYNHVPTSNNASADVVVGQTSFSGVTANQGGSVGANTLNNPRDVFSDGTKLLISDQQNNRILIFNSIPTNNNTSADIVIGQPSFLVNVVNQGGSAAANTLSSPNGITISGGKLFVTDDINNRVLIYNSLPTSNNASADVVVGQPNFSSTAANPTRADTISASQIRGIGAKNGRLYIPDGPNNRILIFNSIPTTNGASADLVIGQPDFTSSSTGGGAQATTLNAPRAVAITDNQLIEVETNRRRVMIFNNVIDTPSMNINLPLEKIDDTHLRVRGNVQLGDRPNYSLQWIKAEVNGQGYVSNLGGGRDNGTNNTLYDFFHEFSPGNVPNTDMNNYTLKLVASSFNADTTSLFYFKPFNFDFVRRSGSNLNISFHVNSTQRQKVIDNVDHFEIQSSTDSGKLWKKYSTNISTDKVDTNTGQVYVTIPNTLTAGIKYWTRIIAVSRDSNWQQPSNIQNYFVPKKK